MTVRELTRPHLEALLVARAVLDPAFADDVEECRLSPAATALLDWCAEHPPAMRGAIVGAPRDEYQLRLVKRVLALTLEELAFFSGETLVALVNLLPIIGAERARSAA